MGEEFVRLDAMDGRNFRPIAVAVQHIAAKGLIVENYAIRVLRDGEKIIVLFQDRGQGDGIKGSAGVVGYEVQMDENLVVTAGHFVR